VAKSAYSELGAQLRARRQAREWTIERLSDESQVSERSIVEFESGRSIPRLETLAKLALALEVEVVTLLTESAA
jgi:transcriptional regulator with XRE-family HTH domain